MCKSKNKSGEDNLIIMQDFNSKAPCHIHW